MTGAGGAHPTHSDSLPNESAARGRSFPQEIAHSREREAGREMDAAIHRTWSTVPRLMASNGFK